jgi:hypothetical protein
VPVSHARFSHVENTLLAFFERAVRIFAMAFRMAHCINAKPSADFPSAAILSG